MSSLRLQGKRPEWYLEVPLLVGGYVGFGLARAAIDRGDPAATINAMLVQRLEQTLHIAVSIKPGTEHTVVNPNRTRAMEGTCRESMEALCG
jgi:hypothetical protein